MERKINVALFCQKLPEIDLKNLQLRPQKTLEFCVYPQPETKKVSSIDQRYLENDSRYITPDDKEKYSIEFENFMREEKFALQEFSPKMPRHINVTYESNFLEIYKSETEDDESDDDDYEEENLEYEYRSK